MIIKAFTKYIRSYSDVILGFYPVDSSCSQSGVYLNLSPKQGDDEIILDKRRACSVPAIATPPTGSGRSITIENVIQNKLVLFVVESSRVGRDLSKMLLLEMLGMMMAADVVLSMASSTDVFSPSTIASSTEGSLTYRLYENAALYGTAGETGSTGTINLTLDAKVANEEASLLPSSPCFLSGELEGSVTFHQDGWYTFDCSFHNTSTGWVWLDGHVVCGDGHAYQPPLWDNPLKIRTAKKATFPFRAHIMVNTTVHCSASEIDPPSLVVAWKREPLLPHSERSMPPLSTEPVVSPTPYHCALGRCLKQPQQQGGHINVTFHPILASPEQRREQLQRRLKQGWGYWLRSNILSIVKLPEGITISFQFCKVHRHRSTSSSYSEPEEDCLDLAVPDLQDVVRVDLHAYDRSYSSYNISFANRTIQMECSVTGSQQQELQYLISIDPQEQCDQEDEMILGITPRYAWFRPGKHQSVQDDISFHTPGFESVSFARIEKSTRIRSEMDGHSEQSNSTGINSDGMRIRITRGMQAFAFAAGFSTFSETLPSFEEIEQHMRRVRFEEEERIRQKFGRKADVAVAIQAAVMWTMIYNPIENGPFMPVSRDSGWDFGDRVKAGTTDWTYVIFDWDNFFASMLAGLDNKDIAYSNLFQVVKSKTVAGFIPNWSTGGAKSQDRTEPPVGAKVLLELFRKYHDKWIVEALFDDLLDWNDWFMERRLVDPTGVIALGSFYDSHENNGQAPPRSNTMWAARMESGLDNSPMYDGELFDESRHIMNISDVGMTSLVCQEAYSLATLADAIGKDKIVGQKLRRRGDDLLRSILSHFWDPDRQVFANRYQLRTNHTSVSHITPTSFYPFVFSNSSVWKQRIHQPLPGVMESVIQAWLLNSSRFCIAPNGDHEGNDPDRCYWGLPSVAADDETFMSGDWNYWRGLIWGPMSQIVFWSLQSNASNKVVNQARESLCRQMEALMMSQWKSNRHICENYSPHKNASNCSGTNFYHWGALNGLIGMIEEGFW